MHVTLPDGTQLELPDGATGADAAAAIGPGPGPRGARRSKVDGELRDLARAAARRRARSRSSPPRPRRRRARADPPRHRARARRPRCSSSIPGTKISIGPPIDDGFYYDFEFPDGRHDLRRATSSASRRRMREHVKADEPFERADVTAGEAIERFVRRGPGLQGRADRGPGRATRASRPSRSTRNGAFTDLCRGPHAPEHQPHQGVQAALASPAPTGAATPTARCSPASTAPRSSRKDELDAHLERLEQARARDHRKLGRELDLFMFSELSPGLAVLAAQRHGASGTS